MTEIPRSVLERMAHDLRGVYSRDAPDPFTYDHRPGLYSVVPSQAMTLVARGECGLPPADERWAKNIRSLMAWAIPEDSVAYQTTSGDLAEWCGPAELVKEYSCDSCGGEGLRDCDPCYGPRCGFCRGNGSLTCGHCEGHKTLRPDDHVRLGRIGGIQINRNILAAFAGHLPACACWLRVVKVGQKMVSALLVTGPDQGWRLWLTEDRGEANGQAVPEFDRVLAESR